MEDKWYNSFGFLISVIVGLAVSVLAVCLIYNTRNFEIATAYNLAMIDSCVRQEIEYEECLNMLVVRQLVSTGE